MGPSILAITASTASTNRGVHEAMERESSEPIGLRDIYASAPLARTVLDWLERNDIDVRPVLEDALARLARRGKRPPRAEQIRYAERVVLGQFFCRWATKNKGGNVRAMRADPKLDQGELRPFQLALLSAADEGAFKRMIPRLARRRTAERSGLWLGTPDEFTAFVAENGELLAQRFLKNFDATRPRAHMAAVRYVQKTAVSHYLVRRTRPIRKDAPNLMDYLTNSKRLSTRTILAIKLAYLPALLTAKEVKILQIQYQLEGNLLTRMSIKQIAKVLGYRNPAALSRKLYRAREWCRRSTAAASQGGDQ